nr:putative ribonuclease H-like domain-containing protein [Tanacetum cinerariifolium]
MWESVKSVAPTPNSFIIQLDGHPQKEDQGYVDSGCSRHMTGNMSYLSDFKEFDGGYVTFGEDPKEKKLLLKELLKLNKVLVVKPHNKTPYELFRCRTPALSFMRPFGCHVTILNTLDYLDYLIKFDGKSDDGFFVGYLLNSKAFRVYNLRTMKVEENLHIKFLENKPIITGTEESISAGHASKVTGTSKEYILMPLWKDDSDDEGVSKESRIGDQERPSINTASLNVNTDGPSINTASTNDNAEVDLINISTTYLVPSTQNTRIHKDHSLYHVIGDVQSSVQTKRMTKTSRRTKKANPSTKRSKLDRSYVRRASAIQITTGFEDPEFSDRVYRVEKTLYGLLQALRAWYETLSTYLLNNRFHKASTPMETSNPLLKDVEAEDVNVHLYRSIIRSLMYLTASMLAIMFIVCACARFQVTPKVSHLHVVKRIFKYLKGQPKLGLWYPKDSPVDLEAYTDIDYVGASLDRKSTTRGCQFLKSKLISWQCKKQTVVANSTTEAAYVAAASYYGQVLWIQNQMLDYGYNFMNTKIFIDNESTICIVKSLVFDSKTKHIEI